MVHKHEKGSGSVAKRLLGLCLALVMLCGVFVPTFASVTGVDDQQPQQEQTAEPTGTDEKQDTEGQQTGGGEQGTSADTENNGGTENDSESTGDADAAKDGEGDANADANANGDGEGTGEANTPANDLPKAETPVVNEVAPQAGKTYTIEVGEEITLESDNGIDNHGWKSSDEKIATVVKQRNGKKATVTGVAVGTVTITHSYNTVYTGSETFTVNVTAAKPVGVYVYVAGGNWSTEMLELLGINPDTKDPNGYYPVGKIELDSSFFQGKDTNTVGAALINSDDDWDNLMDALGTLDTSGLKDETITDTTGTHTIEYSKNIGNKVGNYITKEQVSKALNKGWGSQATALFRWYLNIQNQNQRHCGFNDWTQNVKYHLDLMFTTNKITFKTGNNGITQDISQTAYDGVVVEDRTYITGTVIEKPKEVTPPAGYWVEGYYTDEALKEPWNGVNTRLNADQVVYIKIVEKAHALINYKVATGETTGSVMPVEESFNVERDTPTGSTASPATNYVFEGWYTDAECTAANKVSSDATFTPTAPAAGWESGKTYTYYAKFVPATTEITISKQVTGLLGDKSKNFSFTLKYDTSAGPEVKTFTLHDGQEQKFIVPINAVVTVTEDDYSSAGYTTTYVINGGGSQNSNEAKSSVTITKADGTKETLNTIVFTNHKDATPDTGIFLDSMPYIMALVIVAGGAAVFFLRRRKNSEE